MAFANTFPHVWLVISSLNIVFHKAEVFHFNEVRIISSSSHIMSLVLHLKSHRHI